MQPSFWQKTISPQNQLTNSSHPAGNGYIEGRELDNFLREFVTSIREDKVSPTIDALLFVVLPADTIRR